MNILWFRRDLRLLDNSIVTQATANNAQVLPAFIIDPWFYSQPDLGKARVRFLFESLENLDRNLKQLGSQLYLFEGDAVTILQQLTVELQQLGYQPKLFFNRDVQVQYGIDRDRAIINFYHKLGLDYYLGLNNFLQDEDSRRHQWIEEYYAYLNQPLHPSPFRINTPRLSLNLPQLTFDELKQKYRRFWESDRIYFSGGETNAIATLGSFIKGRFHGYHWKLSRPWFAQQGATSHLSPHLTFGTISTRTVYKRVKARVKELVDQPKAEFSLKAFCDRLRWRDSFTQRLYFHPEIAYQNRYPEFDEYYSPDALDNQKQELFQAWQSGQTGFPMVDANMRQLKTMGWMNFRMRAMCATFLTINCGISWHHGARHYMNCLVDGDLAINNWQWQMQAGIANPLSDSFRIYNPTKNLQEKDENLEFVYHWVPELKGYSLSAIMEKTYIDKSEYPAPILDWGETRKVNGSIVSKLRRRVKERLLAQQDREYEDAAAAKKTVDRYWEIKDKQYQEYKHRESQSEQLF